MNYIDLSTCCCDDYSMKVAILKTISFARHFTKVLLLHLNVGNIERGFLVQCKEVMTRRTSGAQGIADEAMHQKDRSTFLYLSAGVISLSP